MELHLNPEFALEAQEDHLRYIRNNFDKWSREKDFYGMRIRVHDAERFYPNHPTTLKMRAEFDELNKQP